MMMMTGPPAAWDHGVRQRKGKRAPMQMNPGLQTMDDVHDFGHHAMTNAAVAVDFGDTTAMMMNDPNVAATAFLMNPYMSQLQPPPQPTGQYPLFPYPHAFPWNTT
jgi:hypothetical protein